MWHRLFRYREDGAGREERCLGTSSETHESFAVRSKGAVAADVAVPSGPAAQERHPFPALPEGWAVIGRCRFGTGVPGPYATGCYALAHPKVGVALIDVVPNATPNAEARLRRALTAVEFWPDFPGTLPVAHDRLDTAALRSLPWVLDRWFATLPELTVPGGAAWIEGVRRAMATDPAWELPGHPKAAPDALPAPARGADDAAAAPAAARTSGRPRRWGRVAALPVAFAAVFALGLVSGFVLLESPAPVGQAGLSAAPLHGTAASAPASATPKPAEAATAAIAVPDRRVEAPKPMVEAVAPAPAPEPEPVAAAPPSSEPQAVAAEGPPPAVAEAAAVQSAAGQTLGGGSVPASSLERRISLATPIEDVLPMAPPRAPPVPPTRVAATQQASRPAPVIDRACSQALFRFQQGERLSAAEQNFIRTGCSTARR